MKKILSFDIDNTLNEPKMPIFPEMAELLATLSQKYIIAPRTTIVIMAKNHIAFGKIPHAAPGFSK